MKNHTSFGEPQNHRTTEPRSHSRILSVYYGKIFLIYWLVIFSCFSLMSQTTDYGYGNEWIDYSKTYYKFLSEKTGLHRIYGSALTQAGLVNVSASNLKLFSRGVQIPIYTNTNGSMGNYDYIEFYGKINDGYFDTQLYNDPNWQPNEEVSLFTTKSAYFLMSEETGEHFRYETVQNNLNETDTPESYFIYKSRINLPNTFHAGKDQLSGGTDIRVYFPDFGKGEGFVGDHVVQGNPKSVQVPTASVYTAGPSTASVNIRTVGLTKNTYVSNDQHILIKVNNTVYVDEFSQGYEIENYQFNITTSALGATTTGVVCEALDGVDASLGISYTTRYAPVFATITYPHNFNFEGKSSFLFNADISTDRYFEVTNFIGGIAPVVYDLTTMKRLVPTVQDYVYKFKVLAQSDVANIHQIYISSTTDNMVYNNVTAINSIQFIDYSSFQDAENQIEYLIITHPSLRTGSIDWVQQYANYRGINTTTNTPGISATHNKSSTMSSFANPLIIDITQLIDQYSHGIDHHPLAIKNFMRSIFNTWITAPTHCILIGKGIQYNNITYNPLLSDKNLISPYGNAPSDLYYGIKDNEAVSSMAIGRITALEPNDVQKYLLKIIQYEEAYSNAIEYCDFESLKWMKNGLFIIKGWGQDETDQFEGLSDQYQSYCEIPPMGINPLVLRDICDHCYFSNPAFQDIFDNGVSFINYYGHGVGNLFQFDIDTDPNYYSNSGKYPIVLSQGCLVNNIYLSTISSSENYVSLVDERGFIALVGNFSLGLPGFMQPIYKKFYEDGFSSTLGISMVNAMDFVMTEHPNSVAYLSATYNININGDPAIKYYTFDKPEFVVDPCTVNAGTIVHNYNTPTAVESMFDIYNVGAATTSQVNFICTMKKPNGSTININTSNAIFEIMDANGNWQNLTSLGIPSLNYLVKLKVQLNQSVFDFTEVGNHEILIYLDDQNTIPELCDETDNNQDKCIHQVQPANCPENINFASLTSNTIYCSNSTSILNLSLNIPPNISLSNITYAINGNIIAGSTASLSNPNFVQGPNTICAMYNIPNGPSEPCKIDIVINVELPTVPIINATSIACINDPIQLSTVSSFNTYNWSFGESGASPTSSTVPNPSVSFSSPGNKTVTLTTIDSNGCSASTYYTITVEQPLDAPSNLIATNVTTNSATITWTSITDATSYNVFIGNNTEPLNVLAPATGTTVSYTMPTLLPNSTYSVQVQAVNSNALGGCTSNSSSISFTTLTCSNLVSFTPSNTNYCVGLGAIPFNIGVTLGGSSSSGDFTFQGSAPIWITKTGNHSFTIDISGLLPGIYNLPLNYNISNSGCSYVYEYNFTVYAPPTSNAGSDQSNCTDIFTLAATGATSGVWTSSSPTVVSFSNINDPNSTATINSAGSYTLTWTVTNNGCSAADQVVLTRLAAPPTPVFTPPVITCATPSVTLGPPSNSTGYNYQWFNNSGALGDLNTPVSVSQAGTYTLTMSTTTTPVCSTSADFIVTGSTTPPDAYIDLTPASGSTCPILTAYLPQGYTAQSYSWSLEGSLVPNSNFQTISITTPGIYNCTIATMDGCSELASSDNFSLDQLFPTLSNISLLIPSNAMTNNTTWGNIDGSPFTVYVNGQFTVSQQGSLAINPGTSVIFLTTTSGITLELGADLTADGGSNALTPTINFVPLSCNSYWKGIHQKGAWVNTFMDESSVILTNCNIERAVAGLANQNIFKPFLPSKTTGNGRFDVTKCKFLNCKRGIVSSARELKVKLNPSGSVLVVRSNVTNNQFNFTTNFSVMETGYGEDPTAIDNPATTHPFMHISYYQYAPSNAFTKNTFEQSLSTTTPKGVGMWLVNSPMIIGAYTSGGMIAADLAEKNHFNNLYMGINTPSISGLTSNVNVLGNAFVNTRYGVTISANLNNDIIDNTFDFYNIQNYSPLGIVEQTTQYGVHSTGGNGVKINGNTFANHTGNGKKTYGIISRSSVATGATNTILDNYFTGQFYSAQQYEAGNANMNINCNQSPGANRNDWAITSGALNNQGNPGCLSADASLTEGFHITTAGTQDRNVFLHPTASLTLSVLNSTLAPVNNVGGALLINDCFFTGVTPEAICPDWRLRIPLQDLWIRWTASSKNEEEVEMDRPTIAAEIARWSLSAGDLQQAIADMDSLQDDIGRKVLVPTYACLRDSLAAIETLAEIPMDNPENIAFHEYWASMIELILDGDDGDGKNEEANSFLSAIAEDKYNPFHCLYPNLLAGRQGQVIYQQPEPDEEGILLPTEVSLPLTISPNPGTGLYRLEWEHSEEDSGPFSLYLTDINGKTVKETSLYRGTGYVLDISTLPTGTYFVRIITPTSALSGQIIHLSPTR